METTIDPRRKRMSRKFAPHAVEGSDHAHAGEHVMPHDFMEVYRMDPVERIDLIREGVKPQVFVTIAKSMQRSQESLGRLMRMPPTTVARKLQKDEPFSTDHSERLIAAAQLIGQIENMVQESGDLEGFNAAQWFNQWLDKPLHALNNRPPADFMSTAEGRQLLSRLLASAQSGAYA